MKLFSEKNLHTFFEAGLLLKAVDSIVEITLGILFYFLSSQTVNAIISAILGDELTEQPRDTLWGFLLHGFSGLSANTQALWAFLFLGHGIIKICLALGLYKKKMWIYPLAALGFAAFAIYQAVDVYYSHSVLISLLTIYDTIFVGLILHEYRYKKRRMVAP